MNRLCGVHLFEDNFRSVSTTTKVCCYRKQYNSAPRLRKSIGLHETAGLWAHSYLSMPHTTHSFDIGIRYYTQQPMYYTTNIISKRQGTLVAF